MFCCVAGYDLTREKVLHLGPWKVGATLLDNRLSSNYTLCPYNSPNYHSQCSTDSYRLYSRVVPLLTSLASVTDDGLSANLLVFRRNKSFTTTLEKLSNSSQNWTFSSFCLFVFFFVIGCDFTSFWAWNASLKTLNLFTIYDIKSGIKVLQKLFFIRKEVKNQLKKKSYLLCSQLIAFVFLFDDEKLL